MTVKLLTDHALEFLSLKGGCPGSSESIYVKIPHRWKSHVMAHMYKYQYKGAFVHHKKLRTSWHGVIGRSQGKTS